MSDLVYSRADFTWLPREEYEARKAEREERAFWRNRARQGDLCCPTVIRDGMPAVQSMLDGRMYDSKSRLRATYKAAGMVEVGNDGETQRSKQPGSYMEREAKQRAIKETVGKAISAVDTMSSDTIKRRAWDRVERQQRQGIRP